MHQLWVLLEELEDQLLINCFFLELVVQQLIRLLQCLLEVGRLHLW